MLEVKIEGAHLVVMSRRVVLNELILEAEAMTLHIILETTWTTLLSGGLGS
jgi:hypothetical protein